jgi:two-component system sensor histidine kinase ChvG
MSLRIKLLLLSLTTLVLPWAGCQYAREMEAALRAAEEQSLGAVARAMADSLEGRGDLLYRESTQGAFTANPADLVPVALGGAPLLDGYRDDWPQTAVARTFDGRADRLGILAGVNDRMLYLLLDVRDRRVVFDAPGAGPLDGAKAGDRLWLAFQDAEGAERQVFVSATGTGAVQARHIETRDLGEPVAVAEPRIAGAWQLRANGYRVELRLPLSMVGERLGVLVDDRDARGARPSSYGSLEPTEPLRAAGRLIAASPELATYLEQVAQPGLRLAVTTPDGALLAKANAPPPAALPPSRSALERFYRTILVNSGEHRFIEASAPIYTAPPRSALGTLRITQTTDRWLTLRDRALTKLLNSTLVTTLVAALAMLAFAAHLGLRLSRLRRASESALTRSGLNTAFPETAARDELGDVARSFATLLGRLDEYTGYLRTLAGKLAHEIRTPLTIVRSSLENLESETAPAGQARVYLARAREGGERLNGILVAMGAATRVEEAIRGAERSRFDLVPVVSSAVAAYRDAFPQRKFAFEAAQDSIPMQGAPELIVQMLDKLIDNAVDFSPPGATIVTRLAAEPGRARLEVENPGPPLAPQDLPRIFESLWQSRVDADSRPHFGLGLYIVRLIAEFHDGEASAENLSDERGARFVIRLARRQ